jgi:hypothetical protein
MTFVLNPEITRTPTRNPVMTRLLIVVATVESIPLFPLNPTFPKMATSEAATAEINAYINQR